MVSSRQVEIAPCKEIQDSLGFWIPQGNLNSRFQSLVGCRFPCAVFWVPKPRILDSTTQISRITDSTSKHFPDSRVRIPLHGAGECLYCGVVCRIDYICSSLRSRRLEVVGTRKKAPERRRHLARPRSLFCPLLPSACYSGYIYSLTQLSPPHKLKGAFVSLSKVVDIGRLIFQFYRLLCGGESDHI